MPINRFFNQQIRTFIGCGIHQITKILKSVGTVLRNRVLPTFHLDGLATNRRSCRCVGKAESEANDILMQDRRVPDCRIKEFNDGCGNYSICFQPLREFNGRHLWQLFTGNRPVFVFPNRIVWIDDLKPLSRQPCGQRIRQGHHGDASSRRTVVLHD